VQCAGGPALGLHFHDFDRLAEDVEPAVGRPVVDKLGHLRGGGDGVDGGDLGEGVRYVGGGGVAVHCLHFSLGHGQKLLFID
jgi:hypothetical protein